MADHPEKFATRTYRCEWVAKVFPVDQYGQASKEPPFHEKACPTRELALTHLNGVTEPHPRNDKRRVYRDAPHGYYDIGVFYREVLIASTAATE
ncbi:hypothetical protein O9X98_04270 [Agrobacterium salinitolerans]|nr:hypothetical protein [Agrobacterium salinitolerans]